MIPFFWKYRYINLSVIFLSFFLCLVNLKDFRVYFESERIIELADVDRDVIEKSLEDRNITLVGLKFKDSLTYNDMQSFEGYLKNISKSKNIRSIRSVFNESFFFNSNFIPIEIKLLETENIDQYNESVLKINKFNSNYITPDFKNLLFIVKSKNLDNSLDEQIFIDNLEKKFSIFVPHEINITGQMKSELYMQENVYKEAINFTILSFILCSLIIWFFVKDIRIVILNIITVFISILFCFSLSNLLFGGVELVMIIIPAVIFIITISDYMHLINIYKKYKNKYRLFFSQISVVGKPVFLTSFTTAIGFLSFSFCSFEPLFRFGVITTLSIFISLFIIITFFAISIEFNIIKRNSNYRKIDYFIEILQSTKKYKKLLFFLFLLLSSVGIYNLNINNFLTDELNSKSDLYKEIKYFDNFFGGIKPVSFSILENNQEKNEMIKQNIIENDVHIDIITKNKNSYLINTRMKDRGSDESFRIYKNIKDFSKDYDIVSKVGGVGYLFDSISNRLTREVLLGLLLAILTIGCLFVLINDFRFNYFFVSLLPNIIPMTTCLGFLFFFDFYFSLSNAFIFAIVFGLIVDDSIHIISSYTSCRRRNFSIDQSINYCKKKTFRAIVKTTIVIVVTLVPLLFSEFKSISQLAFITILSAIVAIIFDIIFLPSLLKKYIR